MSDTPHYNQKPKRQASFIKPPNILKAKVGYGGLTEEVLDRTEKLLQEHASDFKPLAEIYITRMKEGIEEARKSEKETNLDEDTIAQILFPCVQLKANGGMFHYPLVTRIADRFVQFMEVVERLDKETLDIADAFLTTIKIVVNSEIKGDGGEQGEALVTELNKVCMRYFDKYKDSIDFNKNK